MKIKPTNLSSIPSSTHVDFSSCENIIRKHYNISEYRIITFLQIEIKNKNDKSLVNQVEYQAYDDNKKLLNLSICNNTNIKIYYSIKSNSSIDLSTLNSFKDLNIDLLNIKDKFFTDICTPYSNSDNDIVLSDRIIDFYQNYSLCDDGCMYDEVDLELMIISCNCSVKSNLNITESKSKLEELENIEKSMAFEIIKCYNLVFSWENKTKNFGFWIFSILVIIHLPCLFIYFFKGLTTIREYINNEMITNGYINKNNNNNKEVQNKKNIIKSGKNLKNKNSLLKNKNMIKGKSLINTKNKIKNNNIKIRKNSIKRKKNLNKNDVHQNETKAPPKKNNRKKIKIKNIEHENKQIPTDKLNIILNHNSSRHRIGTSK